MFYSLTLWSIFSFLWFESASGSKDFSLSHPTVLLPYHHSQRVINFTIHLSSGCAKWSSSRPNAVKLIELVETESSREKPCLSSILLSAVLKEPQRIFSVVQADIKHGGPPLVSDVEVNVINRTSIVTTTKILYIGFPFTVFSVHAFDDNGNLFTTIEGIPFVWKVLPDDTSKYPDHTGHNVLKILKWSDVSNEPPTAIADLENAGFRGSSVVISGNKIGVAYIETKISSPVYPNVLPDKVRVIVKDFLILQPSGFVAIVVDQLLEIETYNMNFNRKSRLYLPTDTYWLSLNSDRHLQLYSGTSSLKGFALGETAVCVASTIPDDDSGPCVDVLVTEPHYAVFFAEPEHDWLLEVDLEYEIQIRFYDKSDNVLHAPNLVAETQHESEFVKVNFISKNGTFMRVTPLKVGQSSLVTQLISVVGYQEEVVVLTEKFQVRKTQDFRIIEPVSVTPKKLGFIWMPNQDNSNSYQLAARGGSGSYKWESENIRVVTVTKTGLIETSGTPGISTITVTDRQMSHHFDTSRVLVGPPVRIELEPYYVEGQVYSDLLVPIRLFVAQDPLRIDEIFEVADCAGLPFNVQFSNPDIFSYITSIPVQDTPLNEGCALLWLNTTGSGFTQISVALQDIQNQTTLAGYRQLEIRDFSDTIVLSLGSSVKLATKGGLLPWELDPSQFFQNVEISESSVIKRLPDSRSVNANNVFSIVCSALGESEFSVTIGNRPTAKNKHPMLSTASIVVKCAFPASLRLIPYPFIPDCPPYRNLHSDSLPVLVERTQILTVVAKDSSGLQFANFSSLQFAMSGCKEKSKLDASHFPFINAQFVAPVDCILEVSLAGYRKGFSFREVYDPVSSKLSIAARENPELDVLELSIFNHPSNSKNVQINGGSGYFSLASKSRPSAISDVAFDSKSGTLLVTPLSDGREMITITDVCFPAVGFLQFEVIVSSIGTINVKTKRLMQLNSTGMLEVQVMDSNGWNIEAKMFPVINLTLSASNDFVQFKPLEETVTSQASQNKFSKYFRTFARKVGVVQLHFTATLSSGQISSHQHEIQVFSPLVVNPSVVYMLTDQVYQIKTYGGPQPLPLLRYKNDDITVGGVTSSGLFKAENIGSCSVDVEIVDNTESHVLSKATVHFHVVELTSIELNLALSSFPTESIVPVYVTGNGGKLTPLTFNHGFNFDWSISTNDVVQIIPQHENSGITSGREGNFAIRLRALNPGSSVVKVSVSFKDRAEISSSVFSSGQTMLIAEASLEVYQKLELYEPRVGSQSKVQMTPKSSMFIRSNLNFATFELLHQSDPYLVSMDHRGQITSKEKEGHTILLVRSMEQNGVNQTLSVLIEVKSIEFVRIQTQPVIDSNSGSKIASWDKIPQGMAVNLIVTYHDDQGYMFNAVNAKLKYDLNRLDIGQVNPGSVNHSLMFRNSDTGISALKVWITKQDAFNSELADYILLNVGDVIQMSQDVQSVTVGDVVCFDSSFTETPGGIWSSSSDILEIQSPGIALAVGAGKTEVGLSIGKQRTFKKMEVFNSGRFELSPRSESEALYPSESSFMFDVQKQMMCSNERLGSSFKPDLSWLKCATWFDSHASHLNSQLTVRPVFNPMNGFSCELKIQPTKAEHKQVLASVSSFVNVQATILPSHNRLSVSTPTLKFKFAPQFHVSTNSIILSNHYPTADINVKSNAEVLSKLEVNPKTENLFTVSKLLHEDVLKLTVELLPHSFSRNSASEKLKIQIRCGLSSYAEEVNVYIQLAPYTTDSRATKGSTLGYINENIVFYIPVILTILCLLFGYYMVMLYKQQNKMIDLSLSEAGLTSPLRPRPNDQSFYPNAGMGDAALSFFNRSGSPGSTPYPHFARMRKITGPNRSALNSLDDSLTLNGSPWSGSARTMSPGRVQLWSQTSNSPNDATRGS